MDAWLGNFAYHIEVGIVTLVSAAAVCLLIALMTVSYHSFRVASFNPARSLKQE
jgi:putative ABC transport system permease protein